MAGSSSTLTALRDLIATVLGGVAGLTIYKDGATVLDALPAVEMRLPSIRRPRPDEAEQQIGTVSWFTEWPLVLHVSTDEAANAGDTALQYVALIVAAFDANESLGTTAATGFAVLCRLVDGREASPPRPGDAKPTRDYDMTLEVWQLV